ncbi:hypothetical protein ACO34A_24245 (plasmid) [Rhizobium sp. ACO-34A]|nr:hypothetical protein ACO34A_24245 [Rhizobium sp. ACO-34A]
MVFIDETWAKTNMAPLRGWGPRGQRLIAKAPHGKWRTLTFLAALRHDRIDAPCVIDGPINGTSFAAWVEQFLVPTLRPGDVVVMDNLGSHKRPSNGVVRFYGEAPPLRPQLPTKMEAFIRDVWKPRYLQSVASDPEPETFYMWSAKPDL